MRIIHSSNFFGGITILHEGYTTFFKMYIRLTFISKNNLDNSFFILTFANVNNKGIVPRNKQNI